MKNHSKDYLLLQRQFYRWTMIEVYAIKILSEQEFLKVKNELLSLLPGELRESMLRYRIVNVLQRSLLGELMTRRILADKLKNTIDSFNFLKSEKGKPYLEENPVYFNISHSGEWVVAAFCNSFEVGIDIEKIKPVNFEIAERFFSESEKRELFSKSGDEKLKYFFDLWTMKESYLKLLGKGLTKPLSTFTISGSKGQFHLFSDVDSVQDVNFKQYQLVDDYKLSVCSYSEEFDNKLMILGINNLITRQFGKIKVSKDD